MERKLNTLMDSFLDYLTIEKNCSKLTVRNYSHYLKTFFDYLNNILNKEEIDLSDLTIDNIRKFRIYLSRQKGRNGEMKSVTQGYYVIALRSFLKWMVKNDIKSVAPEKLEVPRNKEHSLKFLNAEQMERLLNQPILSTKIGLRDRTILELLYSTGLRVSELTSLNRSQINLKTREFGIIGKGGRSRVVFISKQAVNFLERYLLTREDGYKPLFIRALRNHDIVSSDEKVRLSVRSIEKIVNKYVRQAKLPILATPHTLRHSMATDLLRAGADLRSVQEILGHKNISTTQIYTHVTDARLREIHDKFHRVNKN